MVGHTWPEVRRRQIYIAPFGIPMTIGALDFIDISRVDFVAKRAREKPTNRGCLFAIAAFRQPYFPAGINPAVPHVRQKCIYRE